MLSNAIINENITIKEALKVINDLAGNTLFVVNKDNKAVGTITDGDIRRGLINNLSLETQVKEVMSTSFKYFRMLEFNPDKIKEFKKNNIFFVPILSEDNEIIDILNLRVLKSILPLEVVIMAGGKGSRLAPLTNEVPKPLLFVGEKPILEHNIDRLISYGINKIYISVNYLKDQIKDYFGDGSSKNISIEYIEEHEITGTLGSVTYINDWKTKQILVMNSDLLTNIDFEGLYQEFLDSNAEMAVASVPYQVSVPYGVLETQGKKIVNLTEKPTYTYYSNAGIYIINTLCLNEIPKKTFYNATELIHKLINENRKVVNYPIIDYWLDIGQHKDFEQANNDIKHLKW